MPSKHQPVEVILRGALGHAEMSGDLARSKVLRLVEKELQYLHGFIATLRSFLLWFALQRRVFPHQFGIYSLKLGYALLQLHHFVVHGRFTKSKIETVYALNPAIKLLLDDELSTAA